MIVCPIKYTHKHIMESFWCWGYELQKGKKKSFNVGDVVWSKKLHHEITLSEDDIFNIESYEISDGHLFVKGAKNHQEKEPAGVYIWFLNIHDEDYIVYIGQSRDVPIRTYQHYGVESGKLYQYIDGVHNTEVAENHYVECGCIPKLKIQVLSVSEWYLSDIEYRLIEKYKPLLNRQRYNKFVEQAG